MDTFAGGPALFPGAADAGFFSGLKLSAVWDMIAQSHFPDYFALFALFAFFWKRRRDNNTADDDSEWGVTKGSMALLIVITEFCRYVLPNEYIFQSRTSIPADKNVVAAAAKCIPSLLPVVGAFINLILISVEPLHQQVPSSLPTISLSLTFVFRMVRFVVLEDLLRSYYADVTVVLLTMQGLLLGVELFWKIFVCTAASAPGQPEVPIWQKIAPTWLSLMVVMPYYDFETIEKLDAEFPAPVIDGTKPLFRPFVALRDTTTDPQFNTLKHFGFTTVRRQFIAVVPPRLFQIVCTFAIPYLVIHSVTVAGRQYVVSDICKLVGWTALVYGGKMLFGVWYQHSRVCLATAIRSTMTNALIEKLLAVSQERSQKFGIAKLFGQDADGIELAAYAFHDCWSAIIELILGLYTVTSITGCSLYMGIFLPLSLTVSERIINVLDASADDGKVHAKERIETTSLYMNQYKELRYTGYAESFDTPMLKLRSKEIVAGNREQTRRSMQIALYVLSKTMAPIGIINTAINKTRPSNPLTVPEYFAVIAVTPILMHSFRTIVRSLHIFSDGMKCLDRVQKFMLLPALERPDRAFNRDDSASRPRNVKLLQATFETPSSKTIRYRDLHFDAGRVTMIIGPQGCGKSSLLKTLLGEMELVSGNIIAPFGPVAYCAEVPFILDKSIRENIVFEAAFDPLWYQHVMHACTLNVEMERLPEGDKTMAGEGGRKIPEISHLVAIARAVYANLPVMILDETFDYCEPKTANTVLTRLFGKGGLIRHKCTVIFSSTTSRDSSHADSIMAFDEARDIQAVSRNLSNLPPNLKFDPDAFDLGPIHGSTRQLIQLREKEFPYLKNTPEAIRADIEAETSAAMSFIAHLDALGIVGIVVAFILAATAVFSFKLPLAYLHRKLEAYDPKVPDSFFTAWSRISAAPLLAIPFCSTLYYMIAATQASFIWHGKIVTILHWASFSFLSDFTWERVSKLFKQDLTLIPTITAKAYWIASFMSLSLLVEMYFAAYSIGSLAFVMAPVGFIFVFTLGLGYAYNDIRLRVLDFDCKLDLYKHIIDMSSGGEHVRAFGLQSSFISRAFELLDKVQHSHYYLLLIKQSLTFSLDLMAFSAAIAAAGCPLFFSTGTQVQVGVSVVTVATLGSFMKDVVESWMSLCTALVPCYNLSRFVIEAPRPKTNPELNFDAADTRFRWPTEGAIQFHNVTAKSKRFETPVLLDINVEINAGSTVGLIGGIASGKTAFLQAILGLLEYEGIIAVDGTDVRQLPETFVQKRIVAVSPYILEFPGTLRQNLDPLHDTPHRLSLSDDVIIDVLKKLTLWREVVRRGATLDSPMTVMGLSQGQNEVLAIARAILRQKHLDAKIIIIDGTLAAVDETLDLIVHGVMAEEFRECTVIKVTQHLATLDGASQVIRIEDGRIDSVFQPGSE